MKILPKVRLVDEMPNTGDYRNNTDPKHVAACYCKLSNEILIQRNATRRCRLLLHELIHWVIFLLGDNNEMQRNHDERSTFTVRRRK